MARLPQHVRTDRSVYRNARLYTEGMDDVFRAHLEFLKLLNQAGGGSRSSTPPTRRCISASSSSSAPRVCMSIHPEGTR